MFTVSLFVNFIGSSGDTLSKLSVGKHHIVFKFIPMECDMPDDFSVTKDHHFEIEPTAYEYTPTESSQPLCQLPHKFTIHPASNTVYPTSKCVFLQFRFNMFAF